MKRKFWMVVGAGVPNYRHYHIDAAREEAERLARQQPNQEFVVLEAVAAVKKTDVAWEELSDDDEPPF
jgi:hypothetical protein